MDFPIFDEMLTQFGILVELGIFLLLAIKGQILNK